MISKSQKSHYQRFIKKLNALLVILLITGLGSLTVHLLSTNKNFMNALALATTVKPETFTELYFQDHLELPSTVTPDEPYSFAFTIHNLENQDMEYLYEVYIDYGDRQVQLDKNAVTIEKDAFITIQQGFLLKEKIDRAKVVIHLTDKNQQIHFWIEGADETI